MWKEKKQIAKQSIFTSMNMNNKFYPKLNVLLT